MRAFGLIVGIAAVISLAPARARAAASSDYPPEVGIAASQLLIGTATASVFFVLPVFTDGTPLGTFAYALLPVGPAAVGGMVCTFGHTSKYYTGSCKPALIGAFLGGLAVVPFTLFGSASGGGPFDNGSDGKNFTSGSAIGFAIGYALGTAFGATIAWHMYKEERGLWSHLGAPPAVPGAESLRWSELAWRPAPAAHAPAGKTTTLLAFTF